MSQLTLFSTSNTDDIQMILLEKLYKHLYAKYEEPRGLVKEKYGDKVVFAHEITRCPRKNEFEKKFPWMAVAVRLRPAIMVGELVHEGLAKLFDPPRSVCKPAGDYVICGSADAMINGYPVEIKFQRRAPESPKDHHLDRIKVYMWLYDKEKGYLIYITPENLSSYVITSKPSEAEIISMIERKVYPRYLWECRLCEYNGICEFAKRSKRGEEEE